MAWRYDYSDARSYCKEVGLGFREDWLPDVDQNFAAAGMDQYQVNVAMRLHIWAVRRLVDTSAYTRWQRFGLALYFMFGWMPK